MKIFLVSNNCLIDGLNYDSDANLDLIRLARPVNYTGIMWADRFTDKDIFKNVGKVYSSFHSSALTTAHYLAKKLNLEINLNANFNDCKVGILGSKNMKMVKGLQDHDFNYKLPNGESLNDVGNRLEFEIKKIAKNNEDIEEIAIFTHRRAILGLLLKYAKVGYNLDDNLILEYEGDQIYDDTESGFDIYGFEYKNGELSIM